MEFKATADTLCRVVEFGPRGHPRTPVQYLSIKHVSITCQGFNVSTDGPPVWSLAPPQTEHRYSLGYVVRSATIAELRIF